MPIDVVEEREGAWSRDEARAFAAQMVEALQPYVGRRTMTALERTQIDFLEKCLTSMRIFEVAAIAALGTSASLTATPADLRQAIEDARHELFLAMDLNQRIADALNLSIPAYSSIVERANTPTGNVMEMPRR